MNKTTADLPVSTPEELIPIEPHLPLPWYESAEPDGQSLIYDKTRQFVAQNLHPADAALIVRCVNHADALAEALRETRMALTLDYTGCTKRNKALCDVSAAASQAHNKAVLALAAYKGEGR